MSAVIEMPVKPKLKTQPLNWTNLIWVAGLHLGVLLAPFFFSWSALVVFAILTLLTGLGVTLGYHRLLTHRSFQTFKIVEYFFAFMGVLANQGGPFKWVAVHRKHHAFADRDSDPHSPKHGFWWAHMGWWMRYDPVMDNPKSGRENIKDLLREPFYHLLERWQIVPPLLLAGLLYGLGTLWGDVGWSWVFWGMFVRTVFVLHATWFVNSAAHVWGYRNFETRDQSTNLWWVALLSFGEGWHNNHHAFQRSARHGLHWWEVDLTYYLIRLLGVFGLAWDIQLAPKPAGKGIVAALRSRVLLPYKSQLR